jgi:hypothetical protein
MRQSRGTALDEGEGGVARSSVSKWAWPPGAAVLALLASVGTARAVDLHVAPGGSDEAAGTRGAPFATINRALAAAMPGDRVLLAPGRYRQDVKSARDGRPDRPITIAGPADAVVQGAGGDRVVEINHDFHVLSGFAVDGKLDGRKTKKSYRDKLVYVIGRAPGRGVTGLRVIGLTVRNAGGECIRLRYLTTRSEISGSQIGPCGAYDYILKEGGKNGEGIYIGTAPEQRGKWGAPDERVDRSDGNWIHHNAFDTRGNECVDIKEGASGNLVEHNACTGQRDKESAGLNARGDRNVFRHNSVVGSRGAGIRFGGDRDGQGIDNEAYGNTLVDNAAGGIALQAGPQGRICENVIEGSKRPTFGDYAEFVDPAGPCADFAWRGPADEEDD